MKQFPRIRSRKVLQRTVIIICLVLPVYALVVSLVRSITGEDVETDDVRDLYQDRKSPGFRPFLPKEAKSLVILAYQRTGSSLFGRMFSSNPSFFYMFEPLDAIYSAMYGTSIAWNVPSDITSYGNGSQRFLPKRELDFVSDSLKQIFTCDANKLPTQALSNSYFQAFRSEIVSLSPFIECIEKFNISTERCEPARLSLESFCGGRFGEKDEDRLSKCFDLLAKKTIGKTKHLDKELHNNIVELHGCLKSLRTDLDSRCTPIFRSACKTRSVRVAKTVRATMESMEPLLRALPNFRVIHLVRDPRGVIISRKNFHESVRGIYSEGATDHLEREAMVYCRSVVHDLKYRQRLEEKYPGRILSIVYDNFVKDIPGFTETVFRFMDLPYTNISRAWAAESVSVSPEKTSTDLAFAWKDAITYRTNENVMRICGELFNLLHPLLEK